MSDKYLAPTGYTPDRKVAARYNVHIKTVKRWARRPDLNFPSALTINGRDYRKTDELDEFDKRAAAAFASKLTFKA